MLTRQLLLELAYWTPPVALLVSSLGLIALKCISGLSPWAKRSTAPPFYFVSLPIATLTVGVEMLMWMIHFFTHGAGRALVDSFPPEWRNTSIERFAIDQFALSPSTPLAVQAGYVAPQFGGCLAAFVSWLLSAKAGEGKKP